jgi:two-component system, chemotaxis family, sensor kinase Cph1
LSHDGMSRKLLVARIDALEAERRTWAEQERLILDLRHQLEGRDALLSCVSHELANLLSSILFNAEIAARPGPEGERRRARAYVDSIRKAGVHMTALLQSLRDAAMMEAGQFTVLPKADDIAPLLADACAIFRARAEARCLRLDLRILGGLSRAWFDRERIHQVVTNLIGNAIEHTLEQGAVIVEAMPWKGSTVRVAVSDTGTGIPSTDLPHLFERYWRTDTGRHRGTGLGLFISKGIVKAHRGELWVESKTGKGSTFFFTLPIGSSAGMSNRSFEDGCERDKSGTFPRLIETDVDMNGEVHRGDLRDKDRASTKV